MKGAYFGVCYVSL